MSSNKVSFGAPRGETSPPMPPVQLLERACQCAQLSIEGPDANPGPFPFKDLMAIADVLTASSQVRENRFRLCFTSLG